MAAKGIPGTVFISCSGTFTDPPALNTVLQRNLSLTAQAGMCIFQANEPGHFFLSLTGGRTLSLSLSGVSIRSFSGGPGGYGALSVAGGASLALTNCSFSDNSASALSLSGQSVAVLNSVDFSNNAYPEPGDNEPPQRGGAMRVVAATVTCDGCSFSENEASDGGGALSCAGGHCVFYHSTFRRNAGGAGGAVGGISGSLTELTACTFQENQGLLGVIYTDGGGVHVHGGLFSGNKASQGGVIMGINSARVTMADCTMENNDATLGGAMYWASSTVVELLYVSLYSNWASQVGIKNFFKANLSANLVVTRRAEPFIVRARRFRSAAASSRTTLTRCLTKTWYIVPTFPSTRLAASRPTFPASATVLTIPILRLRFSIPSPLRC